jgi:hypothetical protein
LRPDAQITTLLDLKRLSHDRFVVDEELEIAIQRPDSQVWRVGRFEQGMAPIDLSQLPMFQMALQMINAIQPFERDGRQVFGVQSSKSHSITLNASSKIDGVELGLNPFDDQEYFRQIMIAQMEMGKSMMGETAEIDPNFIDAMINVAFPQMKKGYADLLSKTFPKNIEVRNGVYATPILKSSLEPKMEGVMGDLMSMGTDLDRVLQYVAFDHGLGSMASNIQVDQGRGVMSFNGSVRLEDIEVDGKETSASLHHIGFIVVGQERAMYVNLVFLEGGGEEISALLEMQEFLRSLRFAV